MCKLVCQLKKNDMKKITLFFLLFSSQITFSQSAGDILFIGFNADGDKDFAVVAMTDLAANTIIYFTDNEPNAQGTGNSNSEGVLKWDTGNTVITAGTVVVFTDVISDGNESFGSSIGTLTDVDSGFNISASGDVVYATYGNPAENAVTTWIAAIQNSDDSTELNFAVTQLSTSSNYVIIDSTASKDGGEYSGVRTGKTLEEYISLIVDDANWTTETSTGENILPFDTTSFSFPTLSFDQAVSDEINVVVKNNKIVANKGVVLKVLNILGQQIQNENLSNGVFLVLVKYNNKYKSFKLSI